MVGSSTRSLTKCIFHLTVRNRCCFNSLVFSFADSLWVFYTWIQPAFDSSLKRPFRVKPTEQNEMSLIEFFELWLSEIINESFWSFLRVHCWKSTVLWLFYCISVSSFMQTNTGSLCVQHFKKCHLLKSFYEAAALIGYAIVSDV